MTNLKVKTPKSLPSSSSPLLVDLSKAICIDCPPQSQRASFPSSATPYCQFPTTLELLEQIGVEKNSETNNTLNKKINFASEESPHVCIVHKCCILSNSHAGTHADQPAHFVKTPEFDLFSDEHYNGSCVVLNVSQYKKQDDCVAITVEMVKPILEQHGILKNPAQVQRILFFTCPENEKHEDKWDTGMMHLDPKCTQFLVDTFENLILVGLDSASLDHPSASPIIDYSHGIVYRNQVAILENLRLSKVFQEEEAAGEKKSLVEGAIMTKWNPMQDFIDARGCFVWFWEMKKSSSASS